MNTNAMPDFNNLNIKGDIFTDKTQRLLYATDASAYREIPLAITRPKDNEDIKKIIAFARKNKLSIIPRTAGTSLAGQVVGNGIVVDVSKYMTQILEMEPLDHTNPVVMNHMTNDDMIAAILSGNGEYMPAWEGILNRDEVEALVSYIRLLTQ